MKLNRLHLSLLSLATVASLALSSCGGSTTPDNGKKQTPEDPKKENPDKNPNTGNLPALSVSIEGEINPTTFVSGQKGSVSFNRFPASVEEFKQVRNRIGKTPHGAAALNIMALEMYRRNANIGMQCLEIIGTKNYVAPKGALMNKLKGGVKKPYQYAAYLDGARYDNGYKPTKPYTIRVKVDEGRQYGKPATTSSTSTSTSSTMVATRMQSSSSQDMTKKTWIQRTSTSSSTCRMLTLMSATSSLTGHLKDLTNT